ncbi:MAG: tRNA-dihydrouridine synthase family protein, partial [Candidatus Aphodousia sp.]|nr:tRNA-dihydrouridine synthase family protein [Candidatus Aphodousia sp.]
MHAKFFGPAPCYYLPFVTPTTEPRFTARQLARELDYDLNRGLNVVPQLLTRRSEDFIWAAKALAAQIK